MPTRRVALAAPLILAAGARAQPVPTQPAPAQPPLAQAAPAAPLIGPPQPGQGPALRILVPPAAGEMVETVIRLLAPRMQARLGQAVTVETGPGADPAALRPLRPDGAALLASGTWFVLDPLLDPGLPWKPEQFQPLAGLALLPNVLVAGIGAPWRTLADLALAARRVPGLAIGAPEGPLTRLLGVLRLRAGIEAPVASYRAAPQVMAALLSDGLALGALPLSAALGTIRAGQLRALAVASPVRSPLLPEVPTTAEAGQAEVVAMGWCGLHAPLGLAPEGLRPLLAGARGAAGNTEARQAAARLGVETNFLDGAGFTGFLAQDRARWERVLATVAGPG